MLSMLKSVIYWETCSPEHNNYHKDKSTCVSSNSVWHNAQHVSFYSALILPRKKLSINFQIRSGIFFAIAMDSARTTHARNSSQLWTYQVLCLTAMTFMLSSSELSKGCLSIRSWWMILPLCEITVFFLLRC